MLVVTIMHETLRELAGQAGFTETCLQPKRVCLLLGIYIALFACLQLHCHPSDVSLFCPCHFPQFIYHLNKSNDNLRDQGHSAAEVFSLLDIPLLLVQVWSLVKSARSPLTCS